ALGIKSEHASVVGGAYVDDAVAALGGGLHPRGPEELLPLDAAGGGIEGVEVRVAAAHVHEAIEHQRRGHHRLQGVVLPQERAVTGIQRIDEAVRTAEEHPAVCDGGTATDAIPRFEMPFLLA